MHPYIKFLGITIPTYGLCMACAVVLVMLLAIRSAKYKGICLEDVVIVGALSIGFALGGAKLLYVAVTYSWEEICTLVQQGNYEFLSGSGLVFLGGLLAGMVGAILGSHITGRQLYEYEGSVVPYIPLGHSVGRLGCFLAGCCYGVPYNGPCAIHYVEDDTGYFPIQLVELFYNLVTCVILCKLAKRKTQKYALLEIYLCLYSLGRFALEFFRGDIERGVFYKLSTAQWICIGLIAMLTARQIIKKGLKKYEEID